MYYTATNAHPSLDQNRARPIERVQYNSRTDPWRVLDPQPAPLMCGEEVFQLRARLVACERVLTRLNGASARRERLLRCGESTEQLAGNVIRMVASLTPHTVVEEDTTLGDLEIPSGALSSRINLQFFDGREIFKSGDFADNHTVGTVAYVIALHLAAGS